VAGEPGWQLSFAAVVALLALVPGLRGWLRDRGLPGGLADATAITLAATLGTAPLMALHFGAVSLASLPANLLAAPAVAPVMWLGMLAALVGQVSASAARAAQRPGRVSRRLRRVGGPRGRRLPRPRPSRRSSGRGGSWVRTRASRRRCSACAPARGGWPGCPARGGRGRRGSGSCLVAVALLTAGGGAPARAPGELVVSFLDVGQGDAVLLQRDGVAILFDTGPPGGPVLRRLRESGVDRLDVLVITHAEADHEGMAREVLHAHRTRLVLNGGSGATTDVQRELPAAAARSGARVVVAHAGAALRLGGLELRLLWPRPARPGQTELGDPNDRAVITHVRLGAFDLLLPADAESHVSNSLALPEAEVLKVAHHGSADPGLGILLARVRPRIAVIPVGARNPYGHPAPPTLAALRGRSRRPPDGPRRHGPAAGPRQPHPGRDHRRGMGPEVTGAGTRLAGRARLQARLPDPRRRPRPDRRAPHPAARDGRDGERAERRGAVRGRRLHRRGGRRRAAHDDVLARAPLRDRRRRRAVEARRRRGGGGGHARDGRRSADRGVLRPRGGPLHGPRRADGGRDAAGGVVAAERTVKPRDLPRWLQARAKECGISIDLPAARALVAQVGERQQRLQREVEKLALELGDGAVVGLEEVSEACASSAERKTWTLADALVAGDARTATRALLELRQQGERLPGLLYGMVRRLRDAHQIAEALAAGRSPGDIKRSLRMPPFAADRLIADVREHDVETYRRALEVMADLELETRGGGAAR
jgi:beta-lactamase superfamily II metal-dependent hydrolase